MVRQSTSSRHVQGWLAALVLLALAGTLVGCGRDVDVTTSLKVTDVVTGWFDAGVTGGKNKLVPTVSFKVKNVGQVPVSSVQFNAVFRVINDPEELGSRRAWGLPSPGLNGSLANLDGRTRRGSRRSRPGDRPARARRRAAGELVAAPIKAEGDTLVIGKPATLFEMRTPSAGGAYYSTHGAGERFVFIPENEGKTDALVNLVVYWPKELKRD